MDNELGNKTSTSSHESLGTKNNSIPTVPVTDVQPIYKATYVTPPTPAYSVETKSRYTKDAKYYNKIYTLDKLNNLVYIILAIAEFFIIGRFIFKLLGANEVGIVHFIYSVSTFFVSPFIGIFGNTPVVKGYIFEWESLVAAVFYAVLFTGITMLIDFFKD